MSEKLSLGNGGEKRNNDEYREVIEQKLEEINEDARPYFSDFCNYNNFDDERLDQMKDRLRRKKAGRKEETDMVSHQTEALLSYSIGRGELFSEHIESFPASELDDECNGIDIVCYLLSGEDKRTIQPFGLDVTTAKSSEKIREKMESFDDAVRKMNGRKKNPKIPSGCSKIEMFKRNNLRTSFSGVPRFVVGFDPENYQKYVRGVNYNPSTERIWHKKDQEMNFKMLSEIYIQAITMRSYMAHGGEGDSLDARKKIYKNCTDIVAETRKQLLQIVCPDGGDVNDFSDMLNQKMRECCESDVTYEKIISMAIRRLNHERGRKVNKTAEDKAGPYEKTSPRAS